MTPDLRSYHWIVLNSSAGKDSQAMLDYVVELASRTGVGRERLVVAHADLGRVEWPGRRALAEEQARHYGLAFYAIRQPQGAHQPRGCTRPPPPAEPPWAPTLGVADRAGVRRDRWRPRARSCTTTTAAPWPTAWAPTPNAARRLVVRSA